MPTCCVAGDVGDQPQLEQSLFEDLGGRALHRLGTAAPRLVARPRHLERGLLRLPDQAVDLGLLLAELAADRNGARHIHAIAVELGGVVDQQQVARLHRVPVGLVVQRRRIHARGDDARISPVGVAPQERELELRLDLVLRRAGHGQRIGALKRLGRDVDRVLQHARSRAAI